MSRKKKAVWITAALAVILSMLLAYCYFAIGREKPISADAADGVYVVQSPKSGIDGLVDYDTHIDYIIDSKKLLLVEVDEHSSEIGHVNTPVADVVIEQRIDGQWVPAGADSPLCYSTQTINYNGLMYAHFYYDVNKGGYYWGENGKMFPDNRVNITFKNAALKSDGTYHDVNMIISYPWFSTGTYSANNVIFTCQTSTFQFCASRFRDENMSLLGDRVGVMLYVDLSIAGATSDECMFISFNDLDVAGFVGYSGDFEEMSCIEGVQIQRGIYPGTMPHVCSDSLLKWVNDASGTYSFYGTQNVEGADSYRAGMSYLATATDTSLRWAGYGEAGTAFGTYLNDFPPFFESNRYFTVDVYVDGAIAPYGTYWALFDIDIGGSTWTGIYDWANGTAVESCPGCGYGLTSLDTYNVYNIRSTDPHFEFTGLYYTDESDGIHNICSTTTSGDLSAGHTRVILNFNSKGMIHFEGNGGSNPDHQDGELTQNSVSGSMEDQIMQFGSSGNLNENKFSRTGYTFIGWNTQADGSGTSYSDRQLVSGIVNHDTWDVTLYAQWRKQLGSGTIAVVDESDWVPVAGASLKLQKSVNGTWTDVTSGTTNSNGTISVGDLHWFNYRWVLTGVPDGYQLSTTNTSFAITYDQLTASNTITLRKSNYFVRYDGNGSSEPGKQDGEFTQNTVTGTMADSEYQYGTKGSLRSNAYAREGYTFTGWNTKADGSETSYSNGYDNVLNWSSDGGTITLYAQWEKKLGAETVTVTDEVTNVPVSGVSLKLQKNVNGTWTDVSSKTTDGNGQASVSSLHWFGYRWVMTGAPTGYQVSTSSTEFTITYNNLQAANQITLYRIKYKVKYDGNGGSNPNYQDGESTQNTVTGTMADSEYQYNTKGSLRSNAYAREGYTFTGWNTKADGSGTSYPNGYDNVLNWSTANGGTITLYAQWEKKLGTETVTVVDEITNAPVGNVSMKLQKNVNGTWTDVTTGKTDGNGRITVNDLHWFGYRWVMTGVPTGYRISTSNTEFTITYNKLQASNQITLYRIWYKVRYDGNGSSEPGKQDGEFTQNAVAGAMADSDYQYDVAGTLRKNAYAREGYTFTGWNTKADGSGTAYADGYNNVLNWSTTDGAVITLYAQWEKKLGTETITVVSEETGNPVKNVSMTLQKSVNGKWVDVTTGKTDASGKITANNLHWFNYRWVMTEVPAGYVKSADTAFSINYNKLSTADQVILYMNHVSITLDSVVSDIIKGENAPAFLYHISGTDAAGVKHEYNLMVQTDTKTMAGSNTIDGIFAGTYTITQIPVFRYNPGNAVKVSNVTVKGTDAVADVLNHNSAEVKFPYTIDEYGWLSGVGSVINSLKK